MKISLSNVTAMFHLRISFLTLKIAHERVLEQAEKLAESNAAVLAVSNT